MQSEGLNGVTGDNRTRLQEDGHHTGPCHVGCHVVRLSHACVCVVGSQAWTPRVGGAMRVGLEVSRVYSRRSVNQSAGLILGGSPLVVLSAHRAEQIVL